MQKLYQSNADEHRFSENIEEQLKAIHIAVRVSSG